VFSKAQVKELTLDKRKMFLTVSGIKEEVYNGSKFF
jgi:hypothetical protein